MKYLFFLLVTFSIYGQQKNISYQDYIKLQERVKYSFRNNIDSCLYYIEEIEKSNNLMHQSYAKSAKAYFLATQGETDNATSLINESKKIINRISNTNQKIESELNTYLFSGNVYFIKKDFDKALEEYLSVKKVAQQNNNATFLIKSNLSIAAINMEINNNRKAISIFKETEKLILKNRPEFSFTDYNTEIARLNLNLGSLYENEYEQKSIHKYLDSSKYYYEKSLLFSSENLALKVKAIHNIGNIYYQENNYEKAKRQYLIAESLSKETNNTKILYDVYFNLGQIAFEQKKYNDALIHFKKLDSIYKEQKQYDIFEYAASNFIRAKIYNELGNIDKSNYHSTIYLQNFDSISKIENKNILEVNYKLNLTKSKEEIIKMRNENLQSGVYKKIFISIFILVCMLSVYLIINKVKSKKRFEKKIETIISEYKLRSENTTKLKPSIDSKETENTNLISIENEKEIFEKFQQLIDRQAYLKQNFTLQYVSRKINTNTTYLSHIVNKKYNQSFSNLINELRINYAINEIIENKKIREYTTQAIAEIVGYKNADSFTTSFKKRTGVTPFQFINEIKINNDLYNS